LISELECNVAFAKLIIEFRIRRTTQQTLIGIKMAKLQVDFENIVNADFLAGRLNKKYNTVSCQ